MRLLIAGMTLVCLPTSVLADELPAQSPGALGRLSRALGLQDAGTSVGVSYYTPTQEHRNIDVTTVDLSRGWMLWRMFEVQGRLGLFHAQGTRTDAPDGVSPDSTATGVAPGAAARLYPLELLGPRPVRPFVEGSAQFLYTPGTQNGFPAGGSGANGFLRAGAGLLVQLGPHLALEATYQWYSHVSDGTGLLPQNPMWNGHGGTLAVRRRF
jgi:hypothetical protein